MLTREPSFSLASTIGLASSTRLPTEAAMRWQIFVRCCQSRNRTGHLNEFAAAFDEAMIRPVDHDVVDRFVHQQWLKRAQAKHVVNEFRGQLVLLAAIQLDPVFGCKIRDQALDLDQQSVRVARWRRRLRPFWQGKDFAARQSRTWSKSRPPACQHR